MDFIYAFANLDVAELSRHCGQRTSPRPYGEKVAAGMRGSANVRIHTLMIMNSLGVFILHHRINMGIIRLIPVWLGGCAVCRG